MLQSKDIFDDGTILGFWKIEETLEELLSMATPELQRQVQITKIGRASCRERV